MVDWALKIRYCVHHVGGKGLNDCHVGQKAGGYCVGQKVFRTEGWWLSCRTEGWWLSCRTENWWLSCRTEG